MDEKSSLFVFHGFHIQHGIRTKELLDKKYTVISDRWSESFIAHTSLYGLLSQKPELRVELEKIAYGNIVPKKYFLIDIDPRIAHNRMKNREKDIYDKLSLKYHESIRKKYLELAKGGRWITLCGNRPIQEIHNEVLGQL